MRRFLALTIQIAWALQKATFIENDDYLSPTIEKEKSQRINSIQTHRREMIEAAASKWNVFDRTHKRRR